MSVSSTASSWAIETAGLTKSYGNHLALRGVDLRVRRGEIVVLFGPNGAGKTTLIKVLATIIRPTAGQVLVEGLDLKSHAEGMRRRIGVVTHNTFLYNHLTAYENLDFYGRVYDIPRRRERVHEVAAQVEMTSRLHDRVDSLSRGMQQRVSIARALLHEPSVMLLDEPETGLDQRTTGIIWSALLGEGTARRTVILTTHSLERGLELSDRLIILDKGRIAYECLRPSIDLNGLKEVYNSTTGARS
jgi:ABC-type multidrug transport system ATPase subunit